MPSVYVFEDPHVGRLQPLTYSRPAFELRAGGHTLFERLRLNLGLPIEGVFVRPSLLATTARRLQIHVNAPAKTKDGVLLVNSRWLLLGPWNGGNAIASTSSFTPPVDTVGISKSSIVWMHLSAKLAADIDFSALQDARTLDALLPKLQRKSVPALMIDRPWDLLAHQRAAIEEDFERLVAQGGDVSGGGAPESTTTGTRHAGTVMPGAHLINPDRIYIASGARIWPGAVLDAEKGPIVIERGAEVRANAVITGPVWVGRDCLIRTASDIREDSSFGPNSRVGGEISNSVFLGYSSKQHLGFLGQTIVGEWCNLGAGTTTSNLKNTYGTVKMRLQKEEESTGRLFMGSIIADHAKLGIGTYLSTGSVIGFGSHVAIPRPPKFVPSFAWLVDPEKGLCRADFEKLEQIAKLAMERRHLDFGTDEHELFVRIASDCVHAEDYNWPGEK